MKFASHGHLSLRESGTPALFFLSPLIWSFFFVFPQHQVRLHSFAWVVSPSEFFPLVYFSLLLFFGEIPPSGKVLLINQGFSL